jgi:hypothetical protein
MILIIKLMPSVEDLNYRLQEWASQLPCPLGGERSERLFGPSSKEGGSAHKPRFRNRETDWHTLPLLTYNCLRNWSI